MPEIMSEWPWRDKHPQTRYPEEWWDGQARVIHRGEVPWWPEGRSYYSVQMSVLNSGHRAGFKVRTRRVDDDTIAFQAYGAL